MAEDALVDTEELREQDRFLPIANISRIMKKSLPDNAKIAKDAKETVQVTPTPNAFRFPSCFPPRAGPSSLVYKQQALSFLAR